MIISKYIRSLLVLLVASVVLSGCFHIIEEVHYKKDGSGTYKFIMDMSEMKEMFAFAMAADTTGSFNMDTLTSMGKEFVAKVKGINGISNVNEVADMDAFHFGVEFDFKDVAALNKASKELFTNDQFPSEADGDAFEVGKKVFKRKDNQGLSGKLQEMMGASGQDDENLEMAKMFFKDASYTMIYSFERKVKKVSNKNAEISDDKKSVTLKYYFFNEEKGEEDATIENTIKLR